jgi:signal transduction histidine kinase
MTTAVDANRADPTSGSTGSKDDPSRRGLYAALSREMCRPLISIRAGFDLLLAGCEGPLPPDHRDQVQRLRGQCDSLIGMTRAFLDFADSSRSARPLDLGHFRLGALLTETDRQFVSRARSRKIDWRCGLSGSDGGVSTDLGCLQQVLSRLVANALEQTADGGRIAVSGQVDSDGWVVRVVDNGCGIPAEALGRVFEPLTRLGSAACAAPAVSPSHGMGLPICRALVDRLGGTITIRSEPDGGTEVVVRFSA